PNGTLMAFRGDRWRAKRQATRTRRRARARIARYAPKDKCDGAGESQAPFPRFPAQAKRRAADAGGKARPGKAPCRATPPKAARGATAADPATGMHQTPKAPG